MGMICFVTSTTGVFAGRSIQHAYVESTAGAGASAAVNLMLVLEGDDGVLLETCTARRDGAPMPLDFDACQQHVTGQEILGVQGPADVGAPSLLAGDVALTLGNDVLLSAFRARW